MSHFRFLHIRELLAQPWLITPEGYDAVSTLVERHLNFSVQEMAGLKLEDLFGEQPQMTIDRASGIAEIPIQGVIGKGLSKIEKSCGAVGTEDIAANLQAALADPSVKGILLNISSPGGTVNGTPETASAIRAATERKPVVAFTDSQMASAAYWLGSQADMVIASSSAAVGSIGVYCAFADQSRRAEMMGIKIDLIKNKEGAFKGAGYPGTSLTDAQRENVQEGVDQIFSMFAGDILAKRTVQKDAMRGQSFLGAEARSRGLVDDVGSSDLARRSLLALIAMRR